MALLILRDQLCSLKRSAHLEKLREREIYRQIFKYLPVCSHANSFSAAAETEIEGHQMEEGEVIP